MSNALTLTTGQYSTHGRKVTNQDFHGICLPKEPLLSAKGVAIALADGISSSDVSHIASQAAVAGFLEDYFCTSDAWSVKKSAQRVLMATNSWLHSQTCRSQYHADKNRGYVCTLSALILKSTTAHVFHIGDARIYRLRDGTLEKLTNDHRTWVSRDTSYLNRALGVNTHVDIDYHAFPMREGDCFLLATDGVYEHVNDAIMIETMRLHGDDLAAAAKAIADHAFQQGSPDNLTVQIARIEALPNPVANELYQRLSELPFPPQFEARAVVDGYTILREIHASSRSHVYLARDNDTHATVVLKTPSIDRQNDAPYLERFLMEEWIARRINSPHVLKPHLSTRPRTCLYVVMEYIDSQTLTQWMADNPNPPLHTVRRIVEQMAKGLQAFHRLEMLHQDLRPDNILIDADGLVTIIDFGSTSVAGIMDMDAPFERPHLLGTLQYTAPEYFLGESGTQGSDVFSLGVIAYQMLTGALPYGTQVPKIKSRRDQRQLRYQSIVHMNRQVPPWVDEAIAKSVHPEAHRRYPVLSEFVFDLNQPNNAFLHRTRPPLLERNPVAFWQMLSLILALVIVALLAKLPPAP